MSNLKQEIANARRQIDEDSTIIMGVRGKILDGAREGKSYIIYGDENMSDFERITIKKYLEREGMRFGMKREVRKVLEEIPYDLSTPDFYKQLQQNGYQTLRRVEKNVFLHFYIYLD